MYWYGRARLSTILIKREKIKQPTNTTTDIWPLVDYY